MIEASNIFRSKNATEIQSTHTGVEICPTTTITASQSSERQCTRA